MTIKTGFVGQTHHASDFADFISQSVGNGICSYLDKLQVQTNNSMNLTIKTGFALINGYYILLTATETVSIEDASALNPRYDAVVLCVDYTDRKVSCQVRKGEPSSNPTKYTPIRNDSVYEAILGYIYVRANTTQILASDIEDTRNNAELCGYVLLQPELQQKLVSLASTNLDGVNQQLATNNSEAIRLVSYASTELTAMVEEVRSITSPIMLTVGRILWSIIDLASSNRFLLCDGSVIPSGYTDLIEYLEDTYTPELCSSTDIVKAYICALNTT